MERAAELHDIGKVGIPAEILTKREGLSVDEWDFMRRHSIIGERILAGIPSLQRAASLVRSSHERWDGAGYPDHLAGADIPLGARIIFVADAFCAMTEARPLPRSGRSSEPVRSSACARDRSSIPRWSRPSWPCSTVVVRVLTRLRRPLRLDHHELHHAYEERASPLIPRTGAPSM